MSYGQSYREQIFKFLDDPDSISGHAFKSFIFLLILVTAAIVFIDQFYPHIYNRHPNLYKRIDQFILIFFTIEVSARFVFSPKKLGFFKNPFNIIDIIAIAPSLLGFNNSAALRTLRILRLLRVFSELKYLSILKFKGTILEKIMPVVLVFTALKFFIWFLETQGIWVNKPDLGSLFTIIGFSLGVVLSLKLGATYNKFLRITEIILRIRGRLLFLNDLFRRYGYIKTNQKNPVSEWASIFLELFKSQQQNSSKFTQAMDLLMEVTISIEKTPGPLTAQQSELASDAAFILGIGRGRTPDVYNILLHQALLIYLLMISLFMPGFGGFFAVIIASHLLYGIYYMTLDLDSIIGGDYQLVSVNLSPIEEIAEDSTDTDKS